MLLGREPEAANSIEEWVARGTPRWDLIKLFLDSPERQFHGFAELGHRISFGRFSNHVDAEGTPDQLETLFSHVRRVWAKFGDEEPYWSVLTGPQFRSAAMNEQTESVFYATGRDACTLFAEACARNGILQPTQGVVLDFGCGLGRLGEHLSHDFAQYVGVDISGPHLAMARAHMEKIGRTNCSFQLLPDFLASPAPIDAFMSLIVLQHNQPPVMRMLLDTLLSRLTVGGVGYFQLPCVLFNYEFRLTDYLETIDDRQEMEMHALPQREVFKVLAENGCRPIEVSLDGLIGDIGLSYTF